MVYLLAAGVQLPQDRGEVPVKVRLRRKGIIRQHCLDVRKDPIVQRLCVRMDGIRGDERAGSAPVVHL